MKRTIGAWADGAVCNGREAVPVVGVVLIKNCTSAVPHNITLFVEFEITTLQIMQLLQAKLLIRLGVSTAS